MLSMIIDNISSFMYSKLLDGLHCIKSWYGKYCRCIFRNLYRWIRCRVLDVGHGDQQYSGDPHSV